MNEKNNGDYDKELIADKLDEKRINKIIEQFGKFGLRADEDLEHFTFIKKNGAKSFIPKRETIIFKDVDNNIKKVKIENYLQDLFNENKEVTLIDVEEVELTN